MDRLLSRSPPSPSDILETRPSTWTEDGLVEGGGSSRENRQRPAQHVTSRRSRIRPPRGSPPSCPPSCGLSVRTSEPAITALQGRIDGVMVVETASGPPSSAGSEATRSPRIVTMGRVLGNDRNFVMAGMAVRSPGPSGDASSADGHLQSSSGEGIHKPRRSGSRTCLSAD